MDGNGFSRRPPLVSRKPMWTSLILGCALRVGEPVAAPLRVTPGEIHATSAEPGLALALEAGLSDALARRGALGGDGGLKVDLTVLDASTEVVAADGETSVRRAHLTLAVQRWGSQPARVVLSGARAYTVAATDGAAAAAARAEAFSGLARSLTADAADWLLTSTGSP